MIIDAHAHVPRYHAPVTSYRERTAELRTAEPFDFHPEELIEDMDKHGIDKSIVQGAGTFHFTYKDMAKQISNYPDRLIGFCTFSATEGFPGGKAAAEQIEEALSMPEFLGVGELTLTSFRKESFSEILKEIRPIMDVITAKNVPVLFHTGVAPYGQSKKHKTPMRWYNPVYIDDIAQEYPDVPIIIGHMGVQGFFYFGAYADMALLAAARNENVYLETSSAPVEVIEKAVCDPAIGAEKVLFGSDYGAPFTEYLYKGRLYPTYGKRPEPRSRWRQKSSLRMIEEAQMSDRERELILGENMARLLSLSD